MSRRKGFEAAHIREEVVGGSGWRVDFICTLMCRRWSLRVWPLGDFHSQVCVHSACQSDMSRNCRPNWQPGGHASEKRTKLWQQESKWIKMFRQAVNLLLFGFSRGRRGVVAQHNIAFCQPLRDSQYWDLLLETLQKISVVASISSLAGNE